MTSEAFNVLWKNHTTSLHDQLYLRYLYQELVDVTIACMDGRLRAHRLVLSSCSKYFKTVFDDNPCEHPVVIVKGASCRAFQSLVLFMYTGSVKVLREDFEEFMSLADELKVRGLCNDIPVDEDMSVNLPDHVTTELEVSGAEESGPGVPKSHSSRSTTTAKSNQQKALEFVNNVSNSKCFANTLEDGCVNSDAAMKECRRVKKGNGKLSSDVKPYFANDSIQNIKQEVVDDDTPSHADEEDLLKNSSPSTSNTQPYKTRFRGKKRVNVGERLFGSESTVTQNVIKKIRVKQEPDECPGISTASDLFCISNLDSTTCDKCLKTFSNNDELVTHQASHVRKKLHQCKVCQHSFSRGSHLQRHERMHTGERPFPCPQCNYRFSRQDKLKHHYRRQHLFPSRPWTSQSRRGRKPRGFVHKFVADSGESAVLEQNTSLENCIDLGNQVHEDLPCLEENLLDSVRQLGECTIQTIPG